MDRHLIQPALAIIAGALLLAWPVALNHDAIVFSDTGALLDMGLLPSMGWDKPFAYGPFAALTSLHLSLAFTALAQTSLLSYALWATQAAFARPTPRHHLILCLALAIGTAAPWFASTILPDAFTSLVALGLLTTLGALPRRHILPITILTAAAIATHLSHLILAAALIAAIALQRRRVPWRGLTSLAAALVFLLATNIVGRGRVAISPYGSIFALARLIGDGPARTYLARICPDPAIMLCAWQTQLTDDSDQFLWSPASPFWSDPLPLPEFAAQASTIVAGTIRTEPLQVLRFAYRNAAHQLIRADLGDTLVADYLADTIRPRLARWYPPAELARFDTDLQLAGGLTGIAAHFLPLQRTILILAAAASTAILLTGLRRPTRRADLAAMILIALAANAFATGALSNVHDRYQARLAWIVVLPFLFHIPRASTANTPLA